MTEQVVADDAGPASVMRASVMLGEETHCLYFVATCMLCMVAAGPPYAHAQAMHTSFSEMHASSGTPRQLPVLRRRVLNACSAPRKEVVNGCICIVIHRHAHDL